MKMRSYFPDTAMFPIIALHSCYDKVVHNIVTLGKSLVCILPVLRCPSGTSWACLYLWWARRRALVTPLLAGLSVQLGFPRAFPEAEG